MSYTPNNIRFRIVSSSAIAQFKQDQAFDFNELINNPGYKFSAPTRETLLLNYELWFKFVLRLEAMMIRSMHSTDKVDALVQTIENQARDVVVEVNEIFKQHPQVFNAATVNHLIQHSFAPYLDNFYLEIAECKDVSMYVAFPKLVTAISNNLHNLLLILHEVDNLVMHHEKPFLSFTDEVFPIWDRLGYCPLQIRSKLYNEQYHANDFVLKNYRGVPVPNECFTNLAKVGIRIHGITDLDTFEHSVCELPNTDKIAN